MPPILLCPIDATSLPSREVWASILDRPGQAMFEGWSDDGAWTIVLPWPDEIKALPWNRADEWLGAMRELELPPPGNDPRSGAPFIGGWIGFVSYETGAQYEAAMPRKDAVPEPPFWFARHRAGIAIAPDGDAFVFDEDGAVERRLEALGRLAATPQVRRSGDDQAARPSAVPQLTDSLPHSSFLAAVEEIRGQIRGGQVYQINLTRRFSASGAFDPAAVYLGMTEGAPPRCSALIRGDGWSIASASPELFLRFDGTEGWAESRPIKGTVRRHGRDEIEREALLRSEKDASEHLMIVDLVRNDLGKVAPPGDVSVRAFRTVRALPHVFHLESTVRAEGVSGIDAAGLFEALFPAGSITGAPKRAAVRSIREIEPCARGVYTGAIGFIDIRGRGEFSVAIRTAVVTGTGTRYHAGGGIVWDSEARAEDAETLAKSVAFLRTFGVDVD